MKGPLCLKLTLAKCSKNWKNTFTLYWKLTTVGIDEIFARSPSLVQTFLFNEAWVTLKRFFKFSLVRGRHSFLRYRIITMKIASISQSRSSPRIFENVFVNLPKIAFGESWIVKLDLKWIFVIVSNILTENSSQNLIFRYYKICFEI